jgi:hypothetical protein
MISSRCTDGVTLDGKISTFTDLRRKLKAELENETLLGSQLFDVWINEDAPPAEGSVDAWEECLEQVRRADLLIALYNGNAGWSKEKGEIGICHAELALGLSSAAAKVRIVSLPIQLGKAIERKRNERFKAYVESQGRFWAAAKDGNEAIVQAKAGLRQAIQEMVQLGGREARKGKFTTGEALDWSRLDFEERQNAIASTLRNALSDRESSEAGPSCVFVTIASKKVLVKYHAIPAAMSIAAAREMVGQPFLHDHEVVDSLGTQGVGPLHIIGCHRSVTEAQGMKQLGFPDATILSPSFGVYVADPIQRIQILFLANCRDETSTRHGVQRAFEWLSQTGEDKRLAKRAEARARIVKAIAAENQAELESGRSTSTRKRR